MQQLIDQAKLIKLLLLDVDGIFTAGNVWYGEQEIELRCFNFHDGLGLKLLQKAGIQVGVISGKSSPGVIKRLKELNISLTYLGQDSKLPAYEAIKADLNFTDQQIAYMGDDLPDLPLLNRAGLAITVPDAPAIIKAKADYTTVKAGGQGAIREICDFLIQAHGQLEAILQNYKI